MRHTRHLLAAALAPVVTAVAACGVLPTAGANVSIAEDTISTPGDRTAASRQLVAVADFASGLRQTVRLVPSEPTSGTDLTIHSTLVNRSGGTITVESRTCGLDTGGSLRLTHPPAVLKCAGYSTTGPLAPGDSVMSSDMMRVTSPAGSYQLTVRHALNPSHTVAIPLRVR